jgi:hypothetical protein
MSSRRFPSLQEQVMIPGGRYLAQARELLSQHNLSPRRRLSEAGVLFWRAYAAQELWPQELREQSEPVIRQLLFLGRIGDTVAAMDEAAVRRVCADLLHFIRYTQRYDERHAA